MSNIIYDTVRQRWGTQNTTVPTDYHERSSARVFFRCLKCQQEYVRMFSAIVDNPDSCSVCSGKIVIEGYNDLASQSPLLALEWSPKNELSPDRIICTGGRHKAWFICSTCSYEWKVSIAFRVKNNNGCPRCAGQVILKGHNDLLSQRPELLSEWNDPTPPDEVFVWSNKKYQWKCSVGHTWEGSPSQRWDKSTNTPRQCNRCSRSKRRSQGEQELSAAVQQLTTHKIEVSYNALVRGIEIDIYLPEQQIAIEYNGEYWHSDEILLAKYGSNSYTFHKSRRDKVATTGTALYYVWEHDWKHHQYHVIVALDQLLNKGTVQPILQHLSHTDWSCDLCKVLL